MDIALQEKYKNTPGAPGVYLMKDGKGRIIYVGKAGNLKKRLAAYFIKETGHDPKTGILIKNIVDFDLIVTAGDHEALILESTLIKKHKPKYNVILKDGKNYPCLRLDTTDKYPALQVVRKIKNDGATYFGPYSSAHSVRYTLKQVNRIFKLRKCKNTQFNNRSRPCLQYQMKTCLGPCCLDVPPEVYMEIVNDVTLFLKGRAPELIQRLKKEMMHQADLQNFEKAAHLRDTLFAIEKTLERQIAVSADMMDRDVIACHGDQGRAVVTLLYVRSGYVNGTRHFHFDMIWNAIPEIMGAFLMQYYENNTFIPPQILLSHGVEDQEILERRFTEKKGRRVYLLTPERGDKKKIMDMARLNAENELSTSLSQRAETRGVLVMLQNLLELPCLPRRIECYDNSNMAGTDPVSSMVVFTDGKPDKAAYRKFIINGVKGPDDYACMTEVLTRRFVPGKKEPLPFPDLLVVDGGKGQLSMAMAVLKDLGMTGQIPVVGLAKKDVEKGEEHDKIYIPHRSNPLNTARAVKALYLLQQLRDEAHRVAIGFQRKRRNNRAGGSILDDIPGIGKKRKTVLLEAYKGISAMKLAPLEELAALPGMTLPSARAVFEVLHP
ncbi:Excinuclease ABC subunit C [Desulfocicer vacuolatum DSM 3385]|uniref:UvrABC system protein C n=1 Tax=Desulfocicer vacuolatum DSM 3385 TaxID=1121400 RepID=A0A1W2AJK2_9BACT|nr:excinuclease ABC subunit UvrC [Desulfocicer vacuolatum]SMC60428.1 Excinuclease ABC subunit C [Desulfocicer vacuolatum DSM 3385]